MKQNVVEWFDRTAAEMPEAVGIFTPNRTLAIPAMLAVLEGWRRLCAARYDLAGATATGLAGACAAAMAADGSPAGRCHDEPGRRFGVRLNKKAETMRDRCLSREEEKRLLDAALTKMNTPEQQHVGALLHDRIIGALELCCRRGERLLIQNKRVNWDTCQIGIPGATAKDKENRRIPFNPNGRLAAILERRAALGGDAYVFGSTIGGYQPNIQTAWETLRLFAHDIEPKPGKEGAQWNREQLQKIDLRWHDLRHEGACRLLADGVDIRIIQLMLGHASIQQTQRYLNVTDEELRRGLEVSWKNESRPLRVVSRS